MFRIHLCFTGNNLITKILIVLGCDYLKKIVEDNIITTYINTDELVALTEFSNCFYEHLINLAPYHNSIIILCIGTDRATGDSLGPLIGYKLRISNRKSAIVYGTLDNPVHAKNIEQTIETIYEQHHNPLVIAIDACLGKIDHVGYITISNNFIKPGAGVNKDLPNVGDIAITGIVNFSGIMDMLILQNTRLNIVMKMADIISNGISRSLWKYEQYCLERIYNAPFQKQLDAK
jgi:putative sporulation protein YyaC